MDQLLPLVKQSRTMSQKYDVVVTNPPYMGSSGMSSKLGEFVKKEYPDSKNDLFAVFIERCGLMTRQNGYQAMITQHAWMFLSSFEKLRAKLLARETINMIHLGARAFEEIGGEVVQTTSFVLQNTHLNGHKGTYCRLIEPNTQQGKEDMFLAKENRFEATQKNFSKIPGQVIAYWLGDSFSSIFEKQITIADISYPRQGLHTGDNNRYLRIWQEVSFPEIMLSASNTWIPIYKWAKLNKGGTFRKWYGNLEYVIDWESNGCRIRNNGHSVGATNSTFLKNIIGFTDISTYKPSFRYYGRGFIYDVSGPSLINESSGYSDEFLIALLNSKIVELSMSVLSPTMHMNQTALSRLSFNKPDTQMLSAIENMAKNCIDISKRDWDSFETSWDFKKHPLI